MGAHKGVVRWFNNVKGYGFVGCDGEKDVFVHYSAILSDGYRTLTEGDPVEYDVVEGSKGPQADQVKRIRAESAQA
ncbi:MAG TPA: cold shock domain-containing protein [Acidobacteriaceae bacterium]|jgi:CspA family cold shock protein